MKALPVLAFLIAPIGFLFSPLSFELSVSILFTAGFAAIAFSDYARTLRPLRVSAPAAVTAYRKERFGLAA